jgi:regulator of cell morphogenesis and NO signaling
MTLTSATTLAEIATRYPALTRELERLGLDDCCKGQRSLAAACQQQGLDPERVVADLSSQPVAADLPAAWIELSLGALVDHLEATHHRYLKQELPRLCELAAKVSKTHGERFPELIRVSAVVAELRAALEPHLRCEEEVLFPMVRTLVSATSRPSFACASTQALMAGLAGLAADTHLHVHKENNHLFPAVIGLEQRWGGF